MLGQYIQVPYIKTILGLATPALIISVIYLLILSILLISSQKSCTLRIGLVKFHGLAKGDKNKMILSMVGYVVFIFSCINLPMFLGEENIIIKISETYLQFESLIFILMLVFLCTAFLNNTNRETHIKASNCFFHYLIWVSLCTGILSGQIDYTYWKNMFVITCAWILNGMFFFVDIIPIQKPIDNPAKFDLIPYGAVKSTDELFPSHREQAEDIASIVSSSSSDPFSICLSGEWGTGKTSVINGTVNLLKEIDENSYDIIYINALELDNKKTVLTYLMSQIKDKLKSRGVYVGINSEYKEFVSSFAGALTSGAIGTFLQKKLASDDDYRAQKKKLEEVIERTYKTGKLIVIVDDIERCDRNAAREYLFLIKEVATMRSCVSIFVTDYDMLNKVVSEVSESEKEYDFLNKFFNYKIDLRDAEPRDILSFYDSFFDQRDPAFWSIYRVICKSPGTWYNEAIAGLSNKLNKLEENSNNFHLQKDEEQKRLEDRVSEQRECQSLFVDLLKNPRNVAKFYNVFRNHTLYCEKHLNLDSNNDEVSKYIDSRNIGQVLYLISFAEVFLPAEYEQIKRHGSRYIDPPLYGAGTIENKNRRLLAELAQGLIWGEYFEFKKPNGYIKTDIRRFIDCFLSKNTELCELVDSSNTHEEKWLKAISESNYQLINEHWEEMVLMVFQKTPNRKTGITDAWRKEKFLFLLKFAEDQVKTGVWSSDRLFSLFDSDTHIDRYWSLGTGLMQTFWDHISNSNVYSKPSNEIVNNFGIFKSHYLYARSGTIYKLAHYLIPLNNKVKTDNIQEYLLHSDKSLSENLTDFLKRIEDAIPGFSFSGKGWYNNIKELSDKINDYLINQGVANYSDISEDIAYMLDTAEEFKCLEQVAVWMEDGIKKGIQFSLFEENTDDIDALIESFDRGLDDLPSDVREQRKFEKVFTSFFQKLQQTENITLTKEQLTHLHKLVEKFSEQFGISSLPYRRTLLNIPKKD